MNTFVFIACGPEHAARADIAVKVLKQHTRNEIVVISARASGIIDHNQVIQYEPECQYSNIELSRFLKTRVNKLLGRLDDQYCYLDNDVLAVHPGVSEIFSHRVGPISFAPDHQSNLFRHAKSALRNPPPSKTSMKLAELLQRRFGVEIDPLWNLWNGGVFLFDNESTDFLNTWHTWTRAIFCDGELAPRDQAALTATIWKFGLPHQRTLPEVFNWIVGCTWGYQGPHYPTLHLEQSLGAKPRFLHFIGDKIKKSEYASIVRNLDCLQ